MTQNNLNKTKKEHAPDCTCSFCGHKYRVFSFKGGYVCEDCVAHIKTTYEYETDTDDSTDQNR